jgi:hypothetical protein
VSVSPHPPSWEPPFPLEPALTEWLKALLDPELARAKKLPAGVLFSASGNHGQSPLAMSLARGLLDNRPVDPALESDLVLLRPSSEPPLHHRPLPPPGGDPPTWGVEAVREGLETLSLAPLRARRRVFLLEGAENLTAAAANALLKSVEEQGRLQTAIFLFTTQDLQRVLPPLRARFAPAELPSLSREALTALLGSQRSSPNWESALLQGGGCLDRTSWYLSPAGASWGLNLRRLMSSLLWGDTWTLAHQIPASWEALSASFQSGLTGSRRGEEEWEDDGGGGEGGPGLKWLRASPNGGPVSPVLWAREAGRLLDQACSEWLLSGRGVIPGRWLLMREDLVQLYSRLVWRWSLTWEAHLFAMMARWVTTPWHGPHPCLNQADRLKIEGRAWDAQDPSKED